MKKAIMMIAAAGLMAPATSIAAELPVASHAPQGLSNFTSLQDSAELRNDRRDRRVYRSGYREGRRDQRLNDRTRVWRGRDGRAYCERDDGTTGLLIGGAIGGLAGNEIAGSGDKLLGTVLGAAGGALLGREIDRDKYSCR